MGNSASTGAPKKGSKAAHKLSKPKTGNPTSTSLLSPSAFSESTHRVPNTKALPLRPEYTSPPSPMHRPSETEVRSSEIAEGFLGIEPWGSALSQLSSPNSSQERKGRYGRRGSTGTIAPTQASRPSRANSMITGTSDWGSCGNPRASLSRNGSRRSSIYDPSSYESRRLLNLAEEPSYEESSIISDGQSSAPGAMGNNLSEQFPEGTAARLSRTGSDVSLYTPMRRRSFLTTPGVATRTAAAATRIPSNPRTRNSLPSPPARRASPEPTRVDLLAVPLAADDPASIPRALTPSDANYKQTGAFKLGTLRITNGSPARSPAAGSASEDEKGRTVQPSPRAQAKSDYFEKRLMDDDAKVLSKQSYSVPEGAPTRRGSLRSYSMTPLSHDNSSLTKVRLSHQNLQDDLMGQLSPRVTRPTPRSPQLQVTSKHTAAEDDLFEDEPRESFSIEVLDIRMDPNAKTHPPRPNPVSDIRISTELSRADSGIGASPVSEVPFKPLAKADSGYSSNVSLRSCSSRRHMHEQDTHSGGELNCPKSPLHDGRIKAEEPRSTGAGLDIRDDASRPSVPEEDHSTNSDAARVTSPPSRRNRRLLSSLKRSKSSISEADNRGEGRVGAQIPAESKSGSTRLTTSISTLSIDIAARKQRGLQKFLSIARAPFTVNTTHTHPSEQTGIPPVLQDAQEKLHKRSGSLPKSFRTDLLRSERSKDTLGTILSVGSAEASGDGIEPVSPSRAENCNAANMEIQQRYPNPSKVLGDTTRTSIVHDTASFAARKLNGRKTMHQHVKSEGLGESTKPGPPRHPNGGSTRIDSGNQRFEERSSPAAASETRAHLVPAPTRTNSATPPAIRSLQSRSSTPKVTTEASAYDPRFPTSAELLPTTKSPPPVSMKTRNQGCVTYRPKHTSPGAPRLRSAPQLVHRESRERPSSHPRNAAASHSTATPIAREPSLEEVRDHSFEQPQPFLHYKPSSSLASYPEVDHLLYPQQRNFFEGKLFSGSGSTVQSTTSSATV
ncbi:hypothetical protein DL769_006492 [Monosporascus sp. CRB-8-3]|nr:hypothetical protein DL769_006492 [Monosporascus sp. CRB-8-3]